ncbi:hypothetical protein WKH56_19620 [Priestia sp. SB1]|uniref:hypothetical protein n=1 Tax=Priestia sp. SB1 TaxID=3132359 RepID=UPI00317CE1F5
MHVYVVNIKKDFQVESYNRYDEKVITNKEFNRRWYVTHEDNYTDEEFKEICMEAMSSAEEKWGIADVLHPFVSMMKDKYGFKDLVTSGSFEFETR